MLALPLALVLVFGVAFAYWTADSIPGGNGASAAASLEAGQTPDAVAAGSGVRVSWAASTLSNGAPVDGYLIRRYDAATLALQTIATACSGVIAATSCTEASVPVGLWVYTVTPVVGTHWVGSESPMSNEVTTDTTPPVNDITASAITGNSFKNADTVYYRGLAAGSFTLVNALGDAGSGPASSQTSALTGSSTGWTHTPSTVSSPTGGPYVSNSFTWASATTSSPTEVVTGRDLVGNTASTTLSFVNDSTAPTGGTVTYPNGYQPDQSVVVMLTASTDAGSGIASRQLQRSAATITAGVCGSFGGFTDVGPDGPPSPYTDTSVSDGTCYQYRYLVTDRVSNQAIATSSNVAKVDSTFGGPAPGDAGSFSVLAGTGVVNTGASSVSGDLGSTSPRSTITGFPPGVVAGDIHANDQAAADGQADLVLAYNDANSRTPTASIAGDLNGLTFHPGVYHAGAAIALTGTMTLDADGDANAIFIFQVDAAMDTAASSIVSLTDGAQASRVFWQVEGAAGTGALSSMSGTIMAAGAITLGAGAQLIGRAMSFGTITMSANVVRFTTALPPTIAITGGATRVTKDTTPTIAGTTNAVVGRTVSVRVAGQTLTTTIQTGGTWAVTAAELTPGNHTVVASVRDAAGNAATASQALTIEVNPAAVDLGSTKSFSVLAATGVVNTGATTISGDLGVSPSSSVTGFPPGVVAGDIHAGDAAAAQGQADLLTAYNELDARTPHQQIVGDLAGQTFHAGIYHQATAIALTGTVTLDAENLPNQIFIFQGDAAMNTAAGSTVNLVNGAQADNVYWQVQGAVGTGASTAFAGTILSAGAITLGASTQLIGRALSRDTVTMALNTVRFTVALPPTIALDGGAVKVTKSTSPTITGTTNAAVGRPVTVKVAGQVLTTTVQSGGTWSVTASAALAAGTYTVLASVRDAAGNAGSTSQALTVEVNPDPVVLGTAASYSVLAATGVVNTLATTLSGNLGVSPSSAVAGFPPGIVSGTINAGNAAAAQARADLVTAYNEVDARTPHREIVGELGGQTFHAGIYHSTAAMGVTGEVTLDAEGSSNAVFIFQGDAALTTAAGANVRLINGAQAANVFFQVPGAVSLGASTTFSGTIMAAGAVTVGDSSRLAGRALSLGTITLANNAITFS